MDLETGRTSEQGRIHKITNYTVSQYILCVYCIELTQLVWDKRVIVNFVYPPLLRGPPCCKVHQWEDTHYQGAHNHTHNEQHILGPLMMVWGREGGLTGWDFPYKV